MEHGCLPLDDPGGGVVVRRVLLHAGPRFVREGLRWVCEREADLEVVATTSDVAELADLCRLHEPDVVLVEVDDLREATAVAGAVFRVGPNTRVVGLQRGGYGRDGATLRRAGFWAVVRHEDGLAALLEALRSERLASITRLPTTEATDRSAAVVLTPREHDVLAHIANGCSTVETSQRLGISAKTVENHKQRMFRKLGVQSQAHAVSVAMRNGALRPTLAREA